MVGTYHSHANSIKLRDIANSLRTYRKRLNSLNGLTIGHVRLANNFPTKAHLWAMAPLSCLLVAALHTVN